VKILALIPARGGSKGIPRKNIKPLVGKPLIAWTITEALKSCYLDEVVVSTEDAEIADVAKQWGASLPFMRPAELAQDDTPGAAPAIHALQVLPGYDVVLLLQPTSPLRTTADIDAFIEKAMEEKPQSMTSVYPTPKNPYWMYTLGDSARLQPIMGAQTIHRRQDMPTIYAANGALYWAEKNWLAANNTFVTSETTGYVMPAERSIDLDSPVDWQLAELLLQSRH
jgi:CMP-N-acetylneuraminic acid synthetase